MTDLYAQAADMIDSLLEDDTGACQMCGEYTVLNRPHAPDCDGIALITALRAPVER